MQINSCFPKCARPCVAAEQTGESGFSLIEAVIAIFITTVVALGTSVVFITAVRYNAGNSQRIQAIAIAQQQVEAMRSARFTSAVRDAILDGGTRPEQTVTGEDGKPYRLQVAVDDDVSNSGVQVNNNSSLKEITITVIPTGTGGTWVAAFPTTITTRRARSN